MEDVKFQCAHCHLPRYPEGTRLTHGLHDTCVIDLYGRETYLKLKERQEARDDVL